MDENATSASTETRASRPPSRPRLLKRFWKTIRKPLANSTLIKNLLVLLIVGLVKLVYRTNPAVAGSQDIEPAIAMHTPAIATLWHGQHLLAPAINPRHNKMVAMFSRSADAELNAMVAERLGYGVVRGSGGRAGANNAGKGGARALIALKRALDAGTTVAMIADIPHGTPREAGLGVVTLAKISGRPVIPVAIATSRRKVLEKSWDKTTINLPFGHRALVMGEPIFVPASADAHELEQKRREVTASLNEATARAYSLVDDVR
jgi:lysophospholipid acyltransferase (LPLAT)-like uncharacterized protein